MRRPVDIGQAFADGRAFDAALARASAVVRREAKLLGQPLAVWQDNQVVWVLPEDTPRTDEEAAETELPRRY